MRNDNSVGALVVLVALAITAGILTFSGWIGVDFSTGASVFGRGVVVLLLAAALIWGLHLPVSFVLPLALAGWVWAFFPAIDFHAAKAMGVDAFGFAIAETPWYAQWYAKAGFVLTPMLGIVGRLFLGR